MAQMKRITLIFLMIIITVMVVLSCKREDTYAGYEKNKVQANWSSQNLSAGGCNNGDVEKHFITPEFAYELIRRYQQASRIPGMLGRIFDENGWLYFETFPAEVISRILAQRGCCRFRVYNGLGEDNRLRFVMVGVNEYGFDYLKCNSNRDNNDSCKNINDLPLIVEMGSPCPEACAGGNIGP